LSPEGRGQYCTHRSSSSTHQSIRKQLCCSACVLLACNILHVRLLMSTLSSLHFSFSPSFSFSSFRLPPPPTEPAFICSCSIIQEHSHSAPSPPHTHSRTYTNTRARTQTHVRSRTYTHTSAQRRERSTGRAQPWRSCGAAPAAAHHLRGLGPFRCWQPPAGPAALAPAARIRLFEFQQPAV
jgi:hypothetical protein